jgi:hypothetical protein
MYILWFIRGVVRGLITPRYRPELHYMRGPGPKWIERHGPGALSGNAAPCPGVGLMPAEDPVLGAVVTASRPLRQGYAPAGTTRRTTSTLVPQADPGGVATPRF